MRARIPRGLKRSFLMFLWLLLAQTVCALVTLFAAALALAAMAFGGTLALSGSTPLWGWIACGLPVCLFWLGMGRLTPRAARPGPAGAVAVLLMWAVLTTLMRGADLIFLAQRACGGMLEQIPQSLEYRLSFDEGRALAMGCFFLPAAFGMGLLLGQKAGRDE